MEITMVGGCSVDLLARRSIRRRIVKDSEMKLYWHLLRPI